jgi:bacterioferritin-associated ferredoxin
VHEQAMTRCECAGLAFEEIAKIALREGITAFEVLCRRTGCAATCTACRPDLLAFLARREGARPLSASRRILA